MADSLWARLEERFDEYSSLPSVEAAARDDDDEAEFGQRHTDATFKVSKRIMCEIKTSNQFRQPKQVEAKPAPSMRDHGPRANGNIP